MAEAAKKPIKTKKVAEPAEVNDKPVPASIEKKPAIVGAVEEKPIVAKAGKRSTKAQKEIEEKQAKQERKATDEPEVKAKPTAKKVRSKAERAGKKYREVAKLVEKDKLYKLPEALELAVRTSTTKFDSTVELHINLGVDPRQADQNVRGTLSLPAGTGKTVRIAVFAEADDAAKAKKAGADIAGSDELTHELDSETIEFDILIATPGMMPRLGKYARLLGPRGLMPNPKSGTVATDVADAVKTAKAGRVEYRVDQAGIIHLGIGKVSFGPQKLVANAEALLNHVKAAKPASLKSNYIKNVTVTTTMGPGIKLDMSSRS